MAKKDFIGDNPALQFISTVTAESQSEDTPAENTAAETENPRSYKLDNRYIEKRTQRVQLLLQPTLWKKAKARAKKNKQSLNDYINELIQNDLQK